MKIINNIKEYLKKTFETPKDIISFFLPIVIAIILIIPVPYYVTVGGGVLEIDKKIEVEDEHKNKGSLNSAYVKEMRGTVFTYLIAKIVPSYELTKIEDVVVDNEEQDDYDFREKLYFTSSLDVATKVAFDYAGKDVIVKTKDLYVIHVDSDTTTDIKTGDIIKKVFDKEVNNQDELQNILNEYNYKDEINITVLRNKKEVVTTTKLIEIDQNKKLGIYIMENKEYETNPKVSFKFNGNQAGSSGGLMISLSIYNKLTSEDITKGKKIVGTGTIDINGNVGEIGGVIYKLQGAEKEDADIFLVPYENYEEAYKYAKEHDYNIKIIKVKTFNETIEALNNI